ncbi:MAG: N-formylglutamate amidohydrolase [Bacteriovoracaceae bacterium]|nr:N-formylglutamate amidohydrolase [Bacteriovoracaceae bacterium]
MHKYSIEEILNNIEKENAFSCVSEDESFKITIEEYVPHVCVAIHNGDKLRDGLRDKINLSKEERWHEEDAITGKLISSLPIRIVALDSRYEYDLNRQTNKCVYDVAWGKKVWKEKLNKNEIAESVRKHNNFYQIIDAIVAKIEKKFEYCVVYDIHSYNYNGIEDALTPLFNIGTKNVDRKYSAVVENWMKCLFEISIKNIENSVKENSVFKGRGFLLKHLTDEFNGTLVLATEIKKVYCNELSGEIHPRIVSDLKRSLKEAIVDNIEFVSGFKSGDGYKIS